MKMFNRLQVATAACAIAAGLVASPASAAIDTTPPAVNLTPGLFIKVGSVLSDSTLNATIPVNVTWGASDDVGITSQSAQYYMNRTYYYPGISAAARQFTVPALKAEGGYISSAYVTAYDAAGNAGQDYGYYYSDLVQQGEMNLGAGWSTASCNCWSGGSVVKSTRAGATAQYQFTGSTIALIGDYAAGRGNVQVYIDGNLQSTVSTAGATKNRVVIYQKRFNTSQTHTLKLVAASSARVDIDGLIVQS